MARDVHYRRQSKRMVANPDRVLKTLWGTLRALYILNSTSFYQTSLRLRAPPITTTVAQFFFYFFFYFFFCLLSQVTLALCPSIICVLSDPVVRCFDLYR